MEVHTKKAIKTGFFSAIGFAITTVSLDYYNNNKLEIWGLLFKILFFGVFMSIYFNYIFKKEGK